MAEPPRVPRGVCRFRGAETPPSVLGQRPITFLRTDGGPTTQHWEPDQEMAGLWKRWASFDYCVTTTWCLQKGGDDEAKMENFRGGLVVGAHGSHMRGRWRTGELRGDSGLSVGGRGGISFRTLSPSPLTFTSPLTSTSHLLILTITPVMTGHPPNADRSAPPHARFDHHRHPRGDSV